MPNGHCFKQKWAWSKSPRASLANNNPIPTTTTFAACSSEISTVNGSYPCIKLTTSPYSIYDKFCPLSEIGFNFFTFICDVNSRYVAWEFGGLLRTFIGHEKTREYRNYTSEFEYHLVRHISENLIDDIYTMRSSLTIFPYNYSFIQFPVVCSTHCGGQPVSTSKVYKVAGE